MTAEDPPGGSAIDIRLRIAPHAIARMNERGVTRANIQRVLRNWDIRRPAEPQQGRKPSEIFIGDVAGRRLKVYVEIGSEPPLVTTVAWEGN